MWIRRRIYNQMKKRIELHARCLEQYVQTIEDLSEAGCADLAEIARLRKALDESERKCSKLEQLARNEDRLRKELVKERDFYKREYMKLKENTNEPLYRTHESSGKDRTAIKDKTTEEKNSKAAST